MKSDMDASQLIVAKELLTWILAARSERQHKPSPFDVCKHDLGDFEDHRPHNGLPGSDTYLPPIRSLAYFRAVALNLSPQERDPAYFDYVWSLYEQLRAPHPEASADTSASACATIRVQSVGDALRLLVVYAEIT